LPEFTKASFSRKIEELGKAVGMTQDEILRNTRTVAQGLDALKEEHEAIRGTLLASAGQMSQDERQLIEEKAAIVDKNLENIRLGIEEAQVRIPPRVLFCPCWGFEPILMIAGDDGTRLPPAEP
jgi:hypothetical protein